MYGRGVDALGDIAAVLDVNMSILVGGWKNKMFIVLTRLFAVESISWGF
jgi:hypothetical protein